MKLTINNTFHHSSVNLIIPDDWEPISLSASQVKRAERALCGIPGCRCGSMWSDNHTTIEGYETSHFEPILDHEGNVKGADLITGI